MTKNPPMSCSTLVSLVFLACASIASGHQNEAKTQQNFMKEVRHQLVLLPYYSVFDNLSYRVEGSTVILTGQVVRPSLKADAEAAVKSVEGVSSVENDVEVLPPRRWTTKFVAQFSARYIVSPRYQDMLRLLFLRSTSS